MATLVLLALYLLLPTPSPFYNKYFLTGLLYRLIYIFMIFFIANSHFIVLLVNLLGSGDLILKECNNDVCVIILLQGAAHMLVIDLH